jgi:hypothetical protein
MLVSSSTPSCRLETLEPRRLLSAAASAGVALEVGLVREMLDADVSAARSATRAAYWRETGALDADALPAGATLDAVAGRTFDFSLDRFAAALPKGTRAAAREVLLPTPQGGFARFSVRQTSLLAPDVAKANPSVRTYRATGIDDPRAVAQFDLSVNGFHATVLSPGGAWSVSPVVEYSPDVRAGRGEYASYFHAHLPVDTHELICDLEHEEDEDHGHGPESGPDAPTGPTHTVMRIAVAGNGEWTAEAGGTAASGFATIVSAVNAADLLYTKEFNVGFTLVSGNNIVYTNAATDPYNNASASTMLSQNQTNLDAVVGSANYDIGHVFTRSGGGVANLGVVGEPGAKARGVSGNSPTTSAFQPTFWHEMGHQFGGAHTWNHSNAEYSGQRTASSAYEPGPGSTILSYGGFSFFPGNFVAMRDNYFHARSLEQISNYVAGDTWGSITGTRTSTGNVAPTVSAGPNRTIPTRTPFELTGSATGSAAMNYTWEQYDLGDEDPIGIDDGNGPLMRSRPATTGALRTFPELADILANRSDADETLPQVARTTDPLTFRLTARDGLGGVNFDAVEVTVVDTGAAFAITNHNGTGTSWDIGSTQTLTWNVAGTTAPQFNAALVSVYLSYDNGATWTAVVTGTPNDGSAEFQIPASAPTTSAARVKVKPDGNVFFDINNAAVAIQPDTVLEVESFTFDFETSHTVGLRFGEPIDVATLSLGDLVVQALPGGPTIPSSHFALTALPGDDEFRFTYAPPAGAPILPDGDYRATIPAGSVADLAGNLLASDLTVEFFTLAGDANRDRTVNLADFNILAGNFGQAGTFSDGDFTYDGNVNLADFNVLAARFGSVLSDPDSRGNGSHIGGDDESLAELA